MSSKRYTDEFKIEAVRQVTDRGFKVAEVAERLGVTTHSLYARLAELAQPGVE
uniref:transposase n=1 Tax=Xanthomonas fragariae TaxID=48664 RepID=UPI00131EF3AD